MISNNIFKTIHDSWIQLELEPWIIKECKPITEFGTKIDTILVVDNYYFNRVGLIAFYIEGCKYPQYIDIPFSIEVKPFPIGALLSRKEIEETKVLTLEKRGKCIYRLTINK